jgi:hypothetical protein
MEYIKIICLIVIIKLCNSNNNNYDVYEISEIKKLEYKLSSWQCDGYSQHITLCHGI